MRNLFSVESRFGQMMCFMADVVLLNLLFLICCLPIFTIGAAQAGLYHAVKPLRDPEDGRSCYKLFFQGFRSGFGTITVTWVMFLLFDLALFYTMWLSFQNAQLGIFIHWGVPLAGLIVSLVLHALTTVFHAQFASTPSQLFRNVFLLLATNPFHSVLVGILAWLPFALYLLAPNFFWDWFAMFVSIYYSLALLVNSTVMKKPFQRIIDSVNGEDLEVKEESQVNS